MSQVIWIIALIITHAVAFYMGRNSTDDDMSWDTALEMYKVDKCFEHMRWLEERKGHGEEDGEPKDQA